MIKLNNTINMFSARMNRLGASILMCVLLIAPFSIEAADMDEVHVLLKQAHAEMIEINDTSDQDKKAMLLSVHGATMEKLLAKFQELQAEGKLSGNSTLMADLMLYEIQMLKAMMSDIESKNQLN